MPTLQTSSFMSAKRTKQLQAPYLWSNYAQGNQYCRFTSSATGNYIRMQCSSSTPQPQPSRPLADYHPGIWGDYFNATVSIRDTVDHDLLKFYSYCTEVEVEVLKARVEKKLLNVNNNDKGEEAMKTIKFINLLYRLGLSYHFEEHIERQLNRIFHTSQLLPHLLLSQNNDHDLHSTAVAFFTFRMHGFNITSDVFDKFMDKDGKFKESLVDVRCLISLYEASFLSMHGEDILEEAEDFTKAQLLMMLKHSNSSTAIKPHVRSYIINALKLPLHRSLRRWGARKYIEFYENEESCNETVLRFAKLDYNRVQLLHQQEISELSQWWKELGLVTELPYARNRLVESYFWAANLCFEPCYAPSRSMFTKIGILITYTDDTYDAYATHEEQQLFTYAFDRWDYSLLDQVPNYLKNFYRAYLDTFVEFENDAATIGRSFSVDYMKEAVKEAVRGYQLESEWLKEGYVPSLAEYLGPALQTTIITIMSSSIYMGMEEMAGVDEFQWLFSKPKILQAIFLMCRIRDDIATHKFEQKREHIASCVECYMKEYGVSEEEAVEELKKMAENAWKDINGELMMMPHPVPWKLLEVLFNMAGLLNVTYLDDVDKYTHPQHFQEIISQLLVEEIKLN